MGPTPEVDMAHDLRQEPARLAELEVEVEHLRRALASRDVIGQAKGVLMERHSLDDREAFELLRSHARANNRKLVDVAGAVVEGHLLLPKQ